MRKKLIAVLVLQLCAVVALLSFPGMISSGFEKNGTLYTQTVTLDGVYREYESEDDYGYILSFGTECVIPGSDEIMNRTTDITGENGYIFISDCVYSPQPITEDRHRIEGYVTLTDTETAKKISDLCLYSVEAPDFEKISSENEVILTFKYYRGRVKLISLTVNGQTPDEFFREYLKK